MTTLDQMIANTQRNVTYLYALIFVASIALLIFLPNPSEVAKTILIASSATLGTILIMQNTFWYGRPRSAGVPDPTTIQTTTTGEPPNASTTTIVTTAAAPADAGSVHGQPVQDRRDAGTDS